MSLLRRLVVLLLTLLPLSASAQFSFGGMGGDQVKADLLADTTSVVPGKPFTVLVRLTMKPTWHVYWQFGGDAGAPPTVTWALPDGFKAGPIQWPIPTAHMDEGDLLTYIYDGEALLPVEITPPVQLTTTEAKLSAKLTWLVCSQECVPGSGNVELTLPVGGEAKSANADLFTKARAQQPQSGPAPFEAVWNVKPEAFSVTLKGVPAGAKVEFYPLPPNPDTRPKRAKVEAPNASGEPTINVPIEPGGEPTTPWQGLVVLQSGDGPRTGWLISSRDTTAPAAKASGPDPSPAPQGGLLKALFAAFFGGLILNLMPCVLPVIALKIFSFVSQAGEHPERVFRLGLSFVAGVFVFFFAIAGLAIGLRAAGHGFYWGMQFADARLMLTLVGLVVIFAMSMFGVFEITLGGSAENAIGNLARKEGYSGAFVHGLFTTLLGTSCTAPLIGPVLGFAVTQPPAGIVLIFTFMAAGMSLPYFLLTWKPAWMRFLPKPGAWMERFKQFMGFVLLAVAVWLLGVFGVSRGPEAAAAAGWLMLLLALASWIYGSSGRRWWGLLIALVVVGLSAWIFLPDALKKGEAKEASGKPNAVGITWVPFSAKLIEDTRSAGKPVFIDFTADWCINCKVNEGAVLNTDVVAQAFRDKGVVTVRADWTDLNPAIGEWLKKFERIGVPLYVLYRPGEDAPVVFPELLTKDLVLDALSPIKAAK